MDRFHVSPLKFCFLAILFILSFSSCDKEEEVVPDKDPRDTTFSINPDDFSITADSTTMATLDSNQSLGFSYAKVISVTARIQTGFAGSLSSFSNAAHKIQTVEMNDDPSEDTEEEGSLFNRLWKSIAGLLS